MKQIARLSIDKAYESSYAINGAGALDSFQDGIRATNPNAQLTVVGHSYGSVVIGQAMQHGHVLDANTVILVAPAGMDALHPSELHLKNLAPGDSVTNHLWEDTDSADIIRVEQGNRHGASLNFRDNDHSWLGELGIDGNKNRHPDHHSDNFCDIHHFNNSPLSGYVWDQLKNHEAYWEKNNHGKYNESAINQGRIIAGKFDKVTQRS